MSDETEPEPSAVRGGGSEDAAWGDVTFLARSRHRLAVLGTLIPAPRATKAIADATGLRMPHVSRALRQLRSRALVDRVPGATRSVSWYRATASGERTWLTASRHRGQAAWIPMVRGTHALNFLRWIRDHRGARAAKELLREAGLAEESLDANGWYPFGPTAAFVEAIERRFGDGTYDLIRRIARDLVVWYPSVMQIVSRALPMELVAELIPAAYDREFNCGRVEVDVKRGGAIFRFYEWVSSPGKCAAFEGAAYGILEYRKRKGSVRKVACFREGDPYCGYEVRWD